MRQTRRCTALLPPIAALLLVVPVTGQDQPLREREVLDPEADTWMPLTEAVAEPPTVPPALDEARALLRAGEPRDARDVLENWLADNQADPRYFEGLFLMGETYFETGDFWKAVEHYHTVAENTAGELFRMANRRCVDVARAFLSGEKRIVWRILRLPAYDEGIEILDRVFERVPGTPLGELALKLKADFYYRRGDLDLAQDEYAFLAQQYPSGRYIQIAMLRSAEAAEAAFPGIKFDDLPLVEAEERYRQFREAFPTYAAQENVTERLEGIRQLRAEKDLYIARWYERTRQPAAAVFYYREILDDYPGTLAADEAQARLAELGLLAEDDTEDEPS